MKKTLLLSALVVTATAFAATTGNFKVDTTHKLELSKDGKAFAQAISDTTHEVKLSTEVTLGESGVTLGGDLTVNKDLLKEEHKVKEFNANVKYAFMTKVEGLKAFVKGNVGGKDLKNIKKDNDKLVLEDNVVNVKGEAEVSYEKSGITYLLNSNTTSAIVTAANTATTFSSEQLLKLSGKKDRLDDILLSFKLNHGYTADAPVLVTLEGKGAIEVVKNLKVGAHDTFYVAGVDGTDKKTKGVILGEDDAKKLNTKGDLANFFALYAEYKTDTFEGMAKTAVEFRKVGTEDNNKELAFGEKLEANYKGVKNLQLKANALFAGIKTDALRGLITLGGNIVYTAKVNDKLTLTPDLGASVKFADLTKDAVVITGQLVPQFKVEYAATKDVKLTSSMKTTVKFDQTNGYNGTDFETKLGLAYTW